ncbi:tyrosine-type recombinase/integrase [Micromonospora fulviviridis]|uniref:Site-specific integrase n=1 Tax=Micromonospora fulviviridis TaxID=47860 RepID=A0ABV2VJH0_9ACTN
MAHVEDRWFKTVARPDGKSEQIKTPLHGTGLRYRVRYIAPDGRERSKSFPDKEKRAAEAFLVSVESDKLRGTYIDPAAGKLTFRQYAEQWLAAQTFDESTREVTERRLRRHIFPYLGGRTLATILPAHLRELDRSLQQLGLTVTYRVVAYSNVATILNAAVDDGRIARNPCHAKTVRPPKVPPRKVVPWSREQVLAIRAGLPARYRVAVDLGAGCGLRQGEVLALAVEDIDFLRGTLHVVRQLKIVGSRLVYALPKGRKTRDIPLPGSVGAALTRHLEDFPPVPVTLPWDVPGGPPVTVNLVVYGRRNVAMDRHTFNRDNWHAALATAGIQSSRATGMHALRHFYASVLLDAGESVKALSEYLGHADPGFTLRTYTHLMPTSEDRTRRAVDKVFSPPSDGLATA